MEAERVSVRDGPSLSAVLTASNNIRLKIKPTTARIIHFKGRVSIRFLMNGVVKWTPKFGPAAKLYFLGFARYEKEQNYEIKTQAV